MRSEKREDGHQLNNWKKDYEGLVVLRLNNYLIYAHYVIRFFIIKAYYLIRQAYRGKYFANSRPFRGGRVSINVIIPVEFVCKRICEYLIIHKLYPKHAFVCLLGEYYNPSVPKWTKCGN